MLQIQQLQLQCSMLASSKRTLKRCGATASGLVQYSTVPVPVLVLVLLVVLVPVLSVLLRCYRYPNAGTSTSDLFYIPVDGRTVIYRLLSP
jgi:hypothetical protein